MGIYTKYIFLLPVLKQYKFLVKFCLLLFYTTSKLLDLPDVV